MEKKRKGEIALALLKYRITQEGIRLTPDFNRELGNMAKKTGIPLNELRQFIKGLVEELIEEVLSNKKQDEKERQG